MPSLITPMFFSDDDLVRLQQEEIDTLPVEKVIELYQTTSVYRRALKPFLANSPELLEQNRLLGLGIEHLYSRLSREFGAPVAEYFAAKTSASILLEEISEK